MNRNTILVVDDDLRALSSLGAILESFGWGVLMVESVPSAMEAMDAGIDRIALVLCDDHMDLDRRGENGEALYRDRKRVLGVLGIPFVLMSGSFTENSSFGPAYVGMHTLAKPYTMRELRQFLLNILPAERWPAA